MHGQFKCWPATHVLDKPLQVAQGVDLAVLLGQRHQHLRRAVHGDDLRQPRTLHIPAMGQLDLVCTAVSQPLHTGEMSIGLGACTVTSLAPVQPFKHTWTMPVPCAPRIIQVWAFVLVALIGGYVGSLFTSFNTWVCLVRKRWSGWFSFRVLEVRGAHSSHTQPSMCASVHTGLVYLTASGPPGASASLQQAWRTCTQVCVLSVITSIIRFALPLAGRCRPCDGQDPDHCVSGTGAMAASLLVRVPCDQCGLTLAHLRAHCPHAGGVVFRTFQGYHCGQGEYNDLAVLVFNPQVLTGDVASRRSILM